MSSIEVRAAFRNEWPQYAANVPLVEVINEPVVIGPFAAQPWGCLLFDAADFRDVTMGSKAWAVETGTVTISITAPAGDGDAAAILVATRIARALLGRRLSPSLIVKSVTGPLDPAPQGEGDYYQVQVLASYEWQGLENRS